MMGQGKPPGKPLNEMEIGNLPEKEFRIMIVKIIQGLRKKKIKAKVEKMQEMFAKRHRTKEQTEMNNMLLLLLLLLSRFSHV